MTESVVIGAGYRTPTIAQRRENGGLLLRQGGRFIILDAAELGEVLAFVRDEPQLGRIERFPVTAPPSDELNFIE
jgi:hypothetical protein